MSENNQTQIPINTQMSDEMGGSEIESNAIRNATIDTQTWQIYDFEKLLDLGELDRYMPIEIQHILALNAAFRSVLPAFYHAYANTFQDIHIQSRARDSTFQTTPYSAEVYIKSFSLRSSPLLLSNTKM